MAQPFNYTIQAPSAFESLVSGLRLGTSLEEMRFQQEQRAAQIAQAQQKAMQERQQQMRLQEIYGKLNAGTATIADRIELGNLSGSEATRKGIWETIGRMDENALNARIGTTQQFAFALNKNPELAKSMMDDYLQANPADQTMKRIRQMADMDPKFASEALMMALPGMGQAGLNAYKETVGRLFPAAEKPAAEPEKIRILRAAGLEPTLENIGKLAAAERAPNADIALMDVLGLPKTEAGFARLNELRQSGRGPLVTVQAGQAAPPSEFEKKVESVAADVYADWALKGGAANARARIAQLDDVVKSLEKSAQGKGPTLTGVQIQLIPEFARPLLVPSSLEARQNAERVIQDGLRAILGAQFTQVEGENFLKRAFDPNLGPDVNARRLSLILEQMKESAKQAQALSDYVEKNRTARGFNGVIPSLAQFEGALARVPAPQRGQQGAADRPAERKPASQLSNEEILRRLGG